jgi:hypothetical protein
MHGMEAATRIGFEAGIGSRLDRAQAAETGAFRFVQISDSHLGSDKASNPDPTATFRDALAEIAALGPARLS